MTVPDEEFLGPQVKMELLFFRWLAHYLNNHPSLRVSEEVNNRRHLENRCKGVAWPICALEHIE